MKLTCDLCGGALQMTSGGRGAVCASCGITYSMERLREKLAAAAVDSKAGERKPDAARSPVHAAPTQYLHIRRKFDLFVCKAAVVLDGNQCAMLEGPGKETVIPVSQGTHTVLIRVASAAGIAETDELTFQVTNHDWYGEFWLHRTALKGIYKFQLREQL